MPNLGMKSRATLSALALSVVLIGATRADAAETVWQF